MSHPGTLNSVLIVALSGLSDDGMSRETYHSQQIWASLHQGCNDLNNALFHSAEGTNPFLIIVPGQMGEEPTHNAAVSKRTLRQSLCLKSSPTFLQIISSPSPSSPNMPELFVRAPGLQGPGWSPRPCLVQTLSFVERKTLLLPSKSVCPLFHDFKFQDGQNLKFVLTACNVKCQQSQPRNMSLLFVCFKNCGFHCLNPEH